MKVSNVEVRLSDIEFTESVVHLDEAFSVAYNNVGFFANSIILVDNRINGESKYRLIDGHKRVSTALAIGAAEIGAMILQLEESDVVADVLNKAAFLRLCSTYQRGDNVLADLKTVHNLIVAGITEKDILRITGLPKGIIAKLMKTNNVPVEFKVAVAEGGLAQKLLFYIANLSPEAQDDALILLAKQKKLSYEDLKRIKNGQMESEESRQKDAKMQAGKSDAVEDEKLQKELRRLLKKSLAKGYTKEELEQVVAAMAKEMSEEKPEDSDSTKEAEETSTERVSSDATDTTEAEAQVEVTQPEETVDMIEKVEVVEKVETEKVEDEKVETEKVETEKVETATKPAVEQVIVYTASGPVYKDKV